MTRPAELPDHDRGHLEDLLASCPHLTVLAENVRADGLGGLLHEYVQVARRSHDVTALSAATPREPSANSRRHLARGRFFERDLRLLVKKSLPLRRSLSAPVLPGDISSTACPRSRKARAPSGIPTGNRTT